MVSVLNKKLWRTIWGSRGQSIAVAAVVLCGTACYISIASAYANLKLTRDTYYARYRLADFEIQLERAPQSALFKLETLPGVHSIQGRIVKDVNVDIAGESEPRIGRIISMPNVPHSVLDDICLLQGRYFDEGAQDQVIMSARFARENHLKVGDRIGASIDNKKYSLRIVGLALSPEYVYMIQGAAELVPSPERFGILWVPQDFAESALDMESACNDVIGSIDESANVDVILDDAKKMLKPYGVFVSTPKADQISNRFLSDEIDGLKVIARIIPAVFQSVAALILLVLLNRMVRKERTEIGLLKAFGYSNWSVAMLYLKYALALSVAGSLAGFGIGQWLANSMIHTYVQFFDFPILRARVYPGILARSMLIGVVFAVLGAVYAVRLAARIQPAQSMRPEAPRSARRNWLERIPALWQQFSFTWKMVARNIARNGFRSAINAAGVMISTGIMITGFFSIDSMGYMIDFQFNDVQREDATVAFESERGKSALYEASRFDHVRYAEPLLQYPVELRSQWRSKDVVVVGLQRGARLQRLMDANHREVDIGNEGLVVSDRLARDLGVGVGDRVLFKPLMGRITKSQWVTVEKVVVQYLGSSAYMNLDAMSRLLDEPFVMNAALLQITPGYEHTVNEDLKDVPAVASVGIKRDSQKSLDDTLGQSMMITTVMTIVFGAVIACSIIYNITTVSLAERQRELSSLRVLGFSASEVGRILHYENAVMGALGLTLGIPFGIGLSRMMANAYDTELYRIPFYIAPSTLWFSATLTLVFIAAANLAVRHKIRRLDMVEVLKERE